MATKKAPSPKPAEARAKKRNHGFSDEVMAKRRRAIADTVRQQILDAMVRSNKEEWTAKDLAASLGLGINGLYYHLRLLEDAQFIVVSGERPGMKGVERTYRPASDQRLTWELDEELVAVLQGNLERAKRDVAERVYDMARREAENDEPHRWSIPVVSGPQFTTTHAEIAALHKDLSALVARYRERAKALAEKGIKPSERRVMRLTYALRELPET
jgi:hypothetical protein